ncbi:YcgN family cysteine cluster protein [Isorropodon fossajaponicum symbiont]|uniref:YcgN family cysteine cluster protein n=1 Tax=Isorropodon fossajaponicum symbiont TaxID=883811 RepID=UPI00315A4537
MTTNVSNFWEDTALEDMTHSQWESLCDNCGRCCLHKLEDEDTGDIYFTDVVCRYIDEQSYQCPHYEMRQQLVPDCLTISPDWGHKFNRLPSTYVYRLLHEKKPLFD